MGVYSRCRIWSVLRHGECLEDVLMTIIGKQGLFSQLPSLLPAGDDMCLLRVQCGPGAAACRNPGWDWKFFPNFSIIVMLEIIMKTSSQPRPWPAASTGTGVWQFWHRCRLFSQYSEKAPSTYTMAIYAKGVFKLNMVSRHEIGTLSDKANHWCASLRIYCIVTIATAVVTIDCSTKMWKQWQIQIKKKLL